MLVVVLEITELFSGANLGDKGTPILIIMMYNFSNAEKKDTNGGRNHNDFQNLKDQVQHGHVTMPLQSCGTSFRYIFK